MCLCECTCLLSVCVCVRDVCVCGRGFHNGVALTPHCIPNNRNKKKRKCVAPSIKN